VRFGRLSGRAVFLSAILLGTRSTSSGPISASNNVFYLTLIEYPKSKIPSLSPVRGIGIVVFFGYLWGGYFVTCLQST